MPNQYPKEANTDGAPEYLLRGLFEHALIEVHVWRVIRDENGEIITWRLVDANQLALQTWGKTKRQVIGLTAEEIFPDGDPVGTFKSIVADVMESGEKHEWEVSFDGTSQILHMVTFPVEDCFVSTGFDVSDVRNNEKALKQALHKLQHAMKDGGVGLWEWYIDSGVAEFSEEYLRQIGYKLGELPNTFDAWRRQLHPDDVESTIAAVQASLESGANYQVEFRIRHKDGTYRKILSQGSVMFDDDGRPTGMRGSHLDVTEKRRLQARVNESQKLEAVGTLAAGIAHDFNNILTALTGNVALLGDSNYAADESERAELLADVEDALSRARALTSQLLTFAKGGSPVRETTDLSEFLVESARFISRGTTVACSLHLESDLPHVDADPGQLNQVINNLLINAGQAMPETGEISLGARRIVLQADNDLGLEPGMYVEISVTDHGTGIPAEIRANVFEPFFTTKEGGSGLGLSTSYAIVKAHGGSIVIEPNDPGTVVLVFLPASEFRAVRTNAQQPSVIRGEGTILVLDDDDAVARALCRLLNRLGFQCESVSTSSEAVHRYQHQLEVGEPYTGVILDLTIPGEGGGCEVIAELLDLDPDVVAIVTSGYTEGDAMADFQSYGFRGRLAKPIRLAALSSTLRDALGGLGAFSEAGGGARMSSSRQ